MAVATSDVLDRAGTSRAARVAACGGFAVAFGLWVAILGVPSDPLMLFVWIWLATIAWNVQAPRHRHLDFARDWWPPLIVLLVYMYSRGISHDLGLVGVHVTEPITLDTWLGGGELPTVRLQSALCGEPCLASADPRWYDVVLSGVYFTHFVTGLGVALALWLRDRGQWARWMRRYLGLNILGLAVYIAYPMAPPWMAAQQGYVTEPLPRLTGRGSQALGLDNFHVALTNVGNPVAAMPSLHAGIAALVAMYGVQRLRSRARWLLLGYPVVMSFMLVYYAEHYVVDALAGVAAAGLVMWVCDRWEGSRRTLTSWPASSRPETRAAQGTQPSAPPPTGPGRTPTGPERTPTGPEREQTGWPSAARALPQRRDGPGGG